MKVLELMVGRLIRQRVEIDEIQCGFMSGHGTTNAIFIAQAWNRQVVGAPGLVHVQ